VRTSPADTGPTSSAPRTAVALGFIWLLGGCAAAQPQSPVASAGKAAVPTTVAASGDAAAASLAGLRLEAPCKGDKFGANTECHWDPALAVSDPRWKLKKEIVRTFGGTPGVVYEVTLRVRGVVEPKNFTGGSVAHEHFQIGGTPDVDHYNFYSLKISDPPQDYTVNRHETKVGHFLFAIDYTVTIPIRGGATAIMGEYDDNDISIANHQNLVVPEISPAPAPFDGQFFQIDVLAATPRGATPTKT
jgi:hypothetical protein